MLFLPFFTFWTEAFEVTMDFFDLVTLLFDFLDIWALQVDIGDGAAVSAEEMVVHVVSKVVASFVSGDVDFLNKMMLI